MANIHIKGRLNASVTSTCHSGHALCSSGRMVGNNHKIKVNICSMTMLTITIKHQLAPSISASKVLDNHLEGFVYLTCVQ